jgi:hypothetical protein
VLSKKTRLPSAEKLRLGPMKVLPPLLRKAPVVDHLVGPMGGIPVGVQETQNSSSSGAL